ncbi:glycosyl hydrolase [Paenibacillus sp. sptzw28]|uniref:glycosyl hydrolase family 18 protein n=1 Tax=Paenibacillus sp. sptzw28 TaxID=715179 RepID=UPI001C6F0913|nr:glycosyl hydrolase family 18 protein [Paenibacillus sp. sptzw28]QYR20718.1 glycosyl hydrolase [Paenibacillus sp. sptzw28]
MQTVMFRPRRRREGGWLKWLVLASGLLAMGIGMWAAWLNFVPNSRQVKPDYGSSYPIMVHGKAMAEGAIVDGDAVKLPLPVIQDDLGLKDNVYYEEKSGSIVLTNTDKVLRLKTNALTATINSKPYELRVAAEVKDKLVYIPSTPIEELYGIRIEYDKQTKIVTVLKSGEAVQRAKAPKGAVIRPQATIRAPIVERLTKNAEVRVWGEGEGWYQVQSESGIIGYAAKKDLQLSQVEHIERQEFKPPFVAWKLPGSKINLTWEAVYQKNPDTDNIAAMNGVNVVSPSWFELIDGSGHIRSKADIDYVNWAHKQGMQVWGLFSNGFEPVRTTQALGSVDSRFSMIQQLLAYVKLYNLQGINLDFENVNTSDKANLVQFVRELTPLLHDQGITVSIDVTPKSNSEFWSLFLDRSSLGKIVDYMILMAYDEHWASSPLAGSVASLPWVEKSLVRILEEDQVPPAKLVLGMPLYTRLWTEKKDENGAVKVSSKALGMESVKSLIAQKKLTPVLDLKAGQHYVEYTENGVLQRIWIEDDLSIKARVGLAKKYGLAGVATWQRAFQSSEVWDIIHQSLTKSP